MMTSETRPPSTPARSSAALNRDFAELMRRQIGERPVKRADRRAGGADNDDVVLHRKLLLAGGCAARAAIWRCRILGSPGSPVNNGPTQDISENWLFFDASARIAALPRRPAAPPQNGGPRKPKPAMLKLWAEET